MHISSHRIISLTKLKQMMYACNSIILHVILQKYNARFVYKLLPRHAVQQFAKNQKTKVIRALRGSSIFADNNEEILPYT